MRPIPRRKISTTATRSPQLLMAFLDVFVTIIGAHSAQATFREVLLLNAAVWIRLLVGAIWLNGALEKLLNPNFPRQFAAALQTGAFINVAPQPVASFMRATVLPNAELFGQLTRLAELALGVALLLGALTNLAALASILYSLLILATQGGVSLGTGVGPPEFFTIDLVVALISLIVLLSPAAKAFSLDAVLARSNPRLAPLLLGERRPTLR